MFDFKQIAKGAEAMGTIGAELIVLVRSIDQHLAESNHYLYIIATEIQKDSDAAMQHYGALNEGTNPAILPDEEGGANGTD